MHQAWGKASSANEGLSFSMLDFTRGKYFEVVSTRTPSRIGVFDEHKRLHTPCLLGKWSRAINSRSLKIGSYFKLFMKQASSRLAFIGDYHCSDIGNKDDTDPLFSNQIFIEPSPHGFLPLHLYQMTSSPHD